jgi:hypothetical protein
MWKSTDAGQTWTQSGLPDSRHIPRVRIHPQIPIWSTPRSSATPSAARRARRLSLEGRRQDLAARSCSPTADAGAVDLAMDPGNRASLYATTWRFRRTPWRFESGGEGSALWKSTDGGDTWTNLPHGPRGCPRARSASSASPSRRRIPQNVYAIVEADEGGVFRSRDGGETWTKTTTAATCASAPGTTRASTPTQGRGHGLRRQRPVPQEQGRRQDLLDHPRRRTATTTTSGSRPAIRCA